MYSAMIFKWISISIRLNGISISSNREMVGFNVWCWCNRKKANFAFGYRHVCAFTMCLFTHLEDESYTFGYMVWQFKISIGKTRRLMRFYWLILVNTEYTTHLDHHAHGFFHSSELWWRQKNGFHQHAHESMFKERPIVDIPPICGVSPADTTYVCIDWEGEDWKKNQQNRERARGKGDREININHNILTKRHTKWIYRTNWFKVKFDAFNRWNIVNSINRMWFNVLTKYSWRGPLYKFTEWKQWTGCDIWTNRKQNKKHNNNNGPTSPK